MGIVTSETMSGLKTTLPACDNCLQPAPLLSGSMGRMLCNTCGDALDATRIAQLAVQKALEAKVPAVKKAQNSAREAARA